MAETLARMEEASKHKAASQQRAATFEAQSLSASSQAAVDRQAELKETIEKRKRARELAVPTNDNAVKLKLREYDAPICIFGELAPERRERLRDVMMRNMDLDVTIDGGEFRGGETLLERQQALAKRQQTGQVHPALAAAAAEEEDKRKEAFYTEGSEELKRARLWLASDSLARSAARLQEERERISRECTDPGTHELEVQRLGTRLKAVTNQLSNFGDERPISFCSFSPGSGYVATGSWSALVKLWSIPDSNCVATLRGHGERISGLAWHPHACVGGLSPTAANLVSASCDSTAKLWPLEGGKPLGSLEGHVGRLSRVAFHPSGKFVGTASFDTTWRMWDVETCKELLLQEGHTRALCARAHSSSPLLPLSSPRLTRPLSAANV